MKRIITRACGGACARYPAWNVAEHEDDARHPAITELRRVKIALIAEWLDPWRGGAETSTMQFVHHLMAGGAELHLFTRSRPSPTPGLRIHTIGGASMSRTRRSVTFAHRVERLLRANSFDMVHAITPCRYADIYQPRGGTIAETIERGIALRRSSPARSLKRYTNHLNLKQRYLLTMERKLLGQRDGPVIVALSDYVVQQLKRHYALPDERIRKVYNGVDTVSATVEERASRRAAIRRDFGIEADDCLVLMVAHNFRLKGVRCWMEAVALLAKRGIRDVRSLVIGKGDSGRWHRLAAHLRIADVLTFTGPSERVRDFYHAGDVLVHPTYYDPCSRVVLEALVEGLACVTTRWDGASEVIDHGKNGYVLDDPGDPAALADLVEKLRQVRLRRALGEAARELAGQVSMARHVTEMTALYEEVVELRHAAGIAR